MANETYGRVSGGGANRCGRPSRPQSSTGLALLALSLAFCASSYAAGAPDAMRNLAQDRGCFVCHEVGNGPRPAAQLLPTAPSFRDIARRYRGQEHAAARLTEIVVNGTPGEHARHWQDQAAGDVMFGDHIVSDDEARRLVAWILAMDAKPSPTRPAPAGKAGPPGR